MKRGGGIGDRLAWLAMALVFLTVLANSPIQAQGLPGNAYTSDAYIWQRQWTGPLAQALESSTPLIRHWRVLAVDVDRYGWPDHTKPDFTRLIASGRPVVMVVRIEGQIDKDLDYLYVRIPEWVEAWRKAGLSPAALEIDHDAATARLPTYVDFLKQLRAKLPPDLPLSITALPTWMDSPVLDQLLATVSESVLQVHAVLDPMRGLFDPQQALAWARAYARRAPHPWRIALPAYGARVAWNNQGRMIAVESERNVLVDGAESRELVVVPQVIATFLRDLRDQPPTRLEGLAWFRLPTAEDSRAWSLATWHTVMAQDALQSMLVAGLRSTQAAGLFDIVLANKGNMDDRLPLRVALPAGCGAADGINGYAVERTDQGLRLLRRQDGLLRAGRERRIGWMRCENGAASPMLD